ncbi:rhamnulose-1-phosphate aldolase [Desulfosarcina sp. OttesenSCG-928-A07]|nr:rhamnulose-1-phosphate aldolase [Desulfosarcina sp. OttesenSCG-928-A07]
MQKPHSALIIRQVPFFTDFIRMTNDACQKGWHERNAGNLSYGICSEEITDIRDHLHPPRTWTPIGVSVPDLGGAYFLVTGSGKCLRNVNLYPEENMAIVRIDQTGQNYSIVWGLEKGGSPTSELPTHLLTHAVSRQTQNGRRVVYHAHPSSIIALSFVLPLTDYAFTRELWGMATECPVVFPDGVGVVPWMVPGSIDIARATESLMRKYSVVVWAHHGVMCAGTDFDDALGLMETVEKSAEISIKVRSMGGVRQSVTPDQLRVMARAAGVTLSDTFLN